MSDPVYCNRYQGPSPISTDVHATTPLEEYDQNFCFEPKILKSDRVEVRPFVGIDLLKIYRFTITTTLNTQKDVAYDPLYELHSSAKLIQTIWVFNSLKRKDHRNEF